jgi:hypothetical protein
MRIDYRRTWGDRVVQFITVASLPTQETVYLTHFKAEKGAAVELRPAFPLRAGLPPGLEKEIEQTRGENCLNMGNRLGFVSWSPLPGAIPSDRFYTSEARRLEVKAGEWFGATGCVVTVCQTYRETEEESQAFQWIEGDNKGEIGVVWEAESGSERVLLNIEAP